MADIELVIKIPEETYNLVKSWNYPTDTAHRMLFELVTNAVPIPKGHGRLKDFDKIEWYGCDFEGKACERANGDCSACNFGNCDAKQLRELPTIIEADKGESEDEE